MTITGSIWDWNTAEGLPAASLTIVDSTGTATSTGTAAAANGGFSLNSGLLDQPGYKVMVSSVGYQSALVDPTTLKLAGGVGLQPQSDDLAAAVVTAARKIPSWYYVVGLAGLAVILVYATDKGKKKLGAMDQKEWMGLALKGGIAVGVYFLVIKPILEKLGLLGSKDDKAVANAKTVDDSLATVQAGGGQAARAFYTDAQYQGWANAIQTQWFSDTPDQSAVVNAVVNANTLTDLLKLIKAFGTVKASNAFWSTCNFLGINCPEYDLPSALTQMLDAQHKSNLNQYLSDQGINYQFQ
jgi:uncharacterized membrane protein